MSRSATPATRNEATTRLKPPKMTTSAELPIGTAIWSSRGRLRTVADGCERLRTVATVNATSSEHTLNPQTPRVKREPLLRIREKSLHKLSQQTSIDLSQITATLLSVCPSPSGSLGLRYHVKTRERRGSSFSQLGLEPNHTGLTAQSLFFLEESCRVKRSDTQTSSNFSNYFKRVSSFQNVLPASPNKTSSAQTHKKLTKLLPNKFTKSSS